MILQEPVAALKAVLSFYSPSPFDRLAAFLALIVATLVGGTTCAHLADDQQQTCNVTSRHKTHCDSGSRRVVESLVPL